MIRPADLALGAPDEPDARRRAERLFDAASQSLVDISGLGPLAQRIATLACQSAPYLATLLIRDPHRLARVAADPYLLREKPAHVVAAEVAGWAAGASSHAELGVALRTVRADELVRLGVRELELGLDTEVGRELAGLADACFDQAIAFCDRGLAARHGAPTFEDDAGATGRAQLGVIGMGKLGGQELNFASDVDVIYVYTSDHGAAGALSLHEYFAKLCTQVTAALSEVTEHDVVFRVDLRLRPEGARGAIASSLDATERYYETFGRPWERQAWLKARPCAGDRALGDALVRALRPFVFPRLTSPSVIDDVRELNRRIKRELVRPARAAAAGPAGLAGFDVKNGAGGIREIEFFVQALQLIHAGKRPALQQRGTLAALDGLLFAGLVTDDEHRALWRAYRWLRHTEHALQLEAGLQTQALPGAADAQRVLARRLGYADVGELAAALAVHTGAASRLFASLGDPTDERAEVTAILRGELAAADEEAALTRLGFTDAAAARAELARARRHSDSPLAPAAVAAERAARIGAALLGEIAASADPDQALRAFGDLIARRGAAWSIWRLLDEQPAIVRLLGSLFGASAYLARTLVDTPELIDLLIALGHSPPTRSVDQIAAELAAHTERSARTDRRGRAVGDPPDPELALSRIAEVKNGHVLRVGLADFAGALDPLEVCGELTAIAEACLDRALGLAWQQLADRHGRPPGDARIAVLGLGKLGGRELGYAADLDVVFVYTADDGDSAGAAPLASVEWFSRLAQRLLGMLRQRTPRGRLYEIDTRLRPSGSQGLLVTSLAGWRRYHAEHARLWERQALVKLRPVAGDRELGAQVAALAAATVYGQPPEAHGGARAIGDAIRAMRDRIERELSGGDRRAARAPGGADLKLGAGGVMDVEFAAQHLQLAFGHAHPALRTTGTAPALAAAQALALAPADDLAVLAQGYRFLRRIEHRLRVVHDQPIHRLPDAPGELDRLARRAGFPEGGVLRAHLARWQHDIRAAYLRVVSGA